MVASVALMPIECQRATAARGERPTQLARASHEVKGHTKSTTRALKIPASK
jgi:hypothetical protein